MTEIVQATTPQQLDQVRTLFRDFVAWAGVRLADDAARVNKYFHPSVFEPELAALPGRYAPPSGSLLLATIDGVPVACVAYRDLGDGVCEMKRMYVSAEARGKGVGRALVARLLADARAAGYHTMRLDTSMHQHEAMALYEQAGFRSIGPYYDVPADLKDWLRYYELKL
ncbi:MAG: GNAT family N-acetyltransferase [Rhizobiaceae bacterium]|nr:GNAT family N-acetyltransferase [Rhizobiaceae bacterium]